MTKREQIKTAERIQDVLVQIGDTSDLNKTEEKKIEDGSIPEGQFYNVTLLMTDSVTGKKVERVIDKNNAFSNGKVCWELKGVEEQRTNIERWIRERGNDQHEMKLVLDSWFFCP